MFDHHRETAALDDRMRRAAARLAACELRAHPHEMCEALAAVADCCLEQQLRAAAEAYLEQALRWSRMLACTDATVDLLCHLAETAAGSAQAQDRGPAGSGRAAWRRARDHAQEAAHLAGQVADSRWEITVLLRISDVLERCGLRDEAASLQTRAMRLMSWEDTCPMADGV